MPLATIQYNIADSEDASGDVVFVWGDNKPDYVATGIPFNAPLTVQHEYDSYGTYDVTITANDNNPTNNIGQITQSVVIQDPVVGMSVDQAIIAEVNRADGTPTGKPLVVASKWGSNSAANAWGNIPTILSEIDNGNYILPWIYVRIEGEYNPTGDTLSNHTAGLNSISQRGLPLAVMHTQLEQRFVINPSWNGQTGQNTPNYLRMNGSVDQTRVDYMGPTNNWVTLATELTAPGEDLREVAGLCPGASRVFFISNNEQVRTEWPHMEDDQRWRAIHGPGQTSDYKRQHLADQYADKLTALHTQFNAALPAGAWRDGIHVGYQAFSSRKWGHTNPGWANRSLHSNADRFPHDRMWDGFSPELYQQLWEWDRNMIGAPALINSFAAFLPIMRQRSPDLFLEMSVWPGYGVGIDTPLQILAQTGIPWTNDRYQGFATWGMWLLRPRVMRDFSAGGEVRSERQGEWDRLLQSVRVVYQNPTLREYWRFGELVPVTNTGGHPLPGTDTETPALPSKEDRWFMLDVSTHPARPWSEQTNIVTLAMALANKAGDEWLVFTFSPEGTITNATHTIPGGPTVVISDSPSKGAFYTVSSLGVVTPVNAY